MFIAGTGIYGFCDHVGGKFWVATRFFTVFFIPLIPLGSYAVFEDTGTSFRGTAIPLSLKSLGLAWLRALLWVPGLGTGLFGLYSLFLCATDGRPPILEALAPVGVSAVLLFLCFKSIGLGFHASPARAAELVRLLAGPAPAPPPPAAPSPAALADTEPPRKR